MDKRNFNQESDMLNFDQYQALAMRTAPNPERIKAPIELDRFIHLTTIDPISLKKTFHTWLQTSDIVHGILGIIGEAGEVEGALEKCGPGEKSDGEIGDAWWYAAILCRGMGWVFTSFAAAAMEEQKFAFTCAAQKASELGELLKKWLFYGKEINQAELWKIAVATMACCSCRAQKDIEKVLHQNIEKLRKRYPDNFSEQAAIERVDVEG